KKKEKKIEFYTVFLFENKGRIGYEKRPSKGLLASLYGFPMEEGFLNGKEIEDYLSEKGLTGYKVIPLGEYEHVFTHKVWKMRGVLVKADEDIESLIHLSLSERMESFPLPSAFSSIEKAGFDHLNRK
ncbi:MAG: NUDIX domain-containing protein, partial [Bacilli bacterium]|nr:NUDIX domain-containing protein [Bacilli bacterium]